MRKPNKNPPKSLVYKQLTEVSQLKNKHKKSNRTDITLTILTLIN